MKSGLATLSIFAATALALPASRIAAQASPDVNGTVRAAAGMARGDGGNYRNRRLSSYSFAIDFAKHRDGGSGPLAGFGFTYYQGAGRQVVRPGLGVLIIDCTPDFSCPQPQNSRERFPDVRLGYVDLGWRRATRNLRGDLLLQPGVVFASQPDIVPISLGGAASVTRRLVGSLGIEIGASSAYLPALNGARIGLSQLTLGFRSW